MAYHHWLPHWARHSGCANHYQLDNLKSHFCKINELVGEDGYTNHCIYAGSHIRNCQFNNLVLRDAFWGSAFKRGYASAADDASGNISINNVSVYNCRTAVYVGRQTDGCIISNVIAEHCQEGILVGSCSNVTIDNCIFKLWKEADLTTVEIDGVEYPVAYDRNGSYKRYACVEFGSGTNIRVTNCSFDAHSCIIYKIYAGWDLYGMMKIYHSITATFILKRFITMEQSMGCSRFPVFIFLTISYLTAANSMLAALGHIPFIPLQAKVLQRLWRLVPRKIWWRKLLRLQTLINIRAYFILETTLPRLKGTIMRRLRTATLKARKKWTACFATLLQGNASS